MAAVKNPMGRLPDPERSAGRVREERPKLPKSERLRALLPDIKALVAPRKGILALGFVLMAINRVSGLVLPASTKFLIDDVIGKRRMDMLLPLLGAVVAATLIQGVTSFSLTQLLSKAAQRLIAELRRKVQAHVGRLPVAVLRREQDRRARLAHHERRRGRAEPDRHGPRRVRRRPPDGGDRARRALQISATMTLLAFTFLVGFGLVLNRAFGTIRPIFRERGKINAEVTGRLTESLGGVRVVKGYHAEEREENVFAAGVQRLLDNVLKTLTVDERHEPLLDRAARDRRRGRHVRRARARSSPGTLTLGGFFTYTIFLGFLVAPDLPDRRDRHAAHRGARGARADARDPAEKPEDADPRRTVALGRDRGRRRCSRT